MADSEDLKLLESGVLLAGVLRRDLCVVQGSKYERMSMLLPASVFSVISS